MLKLSALFSSVVLGAAFDEVVSEHAANGRVYPHFAKMLDTSYGIPLPAKSAEAVKFLNLKLFSTEKALKFGQGEGSMLGAVAVMQSLHAYAQVLVAGMSDKHTKPDVRPLPAWACPVAIASRKAENAAKKAAKQAPVANDDDDDGAESLDASPIADTIPAAFDGRDRFVTLRNELLALLPHGVMTATERDDLIASLSLAVTMPEPQAASAKAAAKAKQATRKAAKASPAIAEAPALVQ